MRSKLSIVFMLSLFSFALASQDSDLSKAPESYRIRVTHFREILRKEKTREAKVKKAITLAKDRKSPYRMDAVNFLAETRSPESVPVLIGLAKDRSVAEFPIYALGETRSKNSIPVILDSLSSDDENVRGNAEKALRKITRINFAYSYSAPNAQRKKAISDIRRWWDSHKDTFVVKEETPEEKKEAEEAWEKYGKQYVNDLSR